MPCPLSFSQQRLWFIQQVEPENRTFHNGMVWQLTGPLNVDALTRSLAEIVRRHTPLRTRLLMQAGVPVQSIDRAGVFHLPTIDLRPQNGAEPQPTEQLQRLSRELIQRPYDFATEHAWRFQLVQLADDSHGLIVAHHHIATDGWSTGIFQRELSLLYAAFAAGEPSPLAPLPITYADFAVWQRAQLQGTRLAQQLAYWQQQLQQPPVLALPTDYPRPAAQHDTAATYEFTLSVALTAALKTLSKAQGATLYMTLLTVFKVLLFRYTGQTDLSVGAPIAGRSCAEAETLIGFFLNTLILRAQLNPDATFLELLGQVRQTALDAYAHQDIPIEKLIEVLHQERSMEESPLFQVLFLLQNMPRHQLVLPDLTVTPMGQEVTGTAADLDCRLHENGDQLVGRLTYRRERFRPTTIARLAGHYQTLLASAVANPTGKLGTLPMLTATERHQLVVTWNQTTVHHPLDKSLLTLFAAQVAQRPHATAFLTDEATLTYAQLNQRADQLAHVLGAAGVAKGAIVGVCLPRTFDAVVALLAIFKVGGVYLPLDPAYPHARLAFMLTDSQAPVVITTTQLQSSLSTNRATMVCLDTLPAQPSSLPVAVVPSQPDDPAYIIYTSGSTGQPKGAVIPHRQILNRLWWMWRAYPFQADDMSCQKTALNFVDSLWELLGPLLQGSPTVILADEVVRDPQRLIQSLAQHAVTRLWLVPTLLRLLLQNAPDLGARLPHLRFLVASGEALPTALFEQVQAQMPHATLYNLYGTSEVWDATWYDPQESPGTERTNSTMPIGKPLDNVQTYILDAQQQPVPIGVTGELYVGGAGLATGYHNRPDLTQARFVTVDQLQITEPTTSPGPRLYKTGDLARYQPDGNIEFMGRADFQVKLRGLRIELEEIEAQLLQHPAVREAVVVLHPPAASEQRLVAYLTGAAACEPATLHQWLSTRVPLFMVPSAFRFVASLPLTPSGKVDRLTLARQPVDQLPTHAYIAPTEPLEIALAAIWGQLLGVAQVSVNARFFELGGHSLLAIALMAEMRRVFGLDVPLSTLFADPTIAGLATYLRPALAARHQPANRATTPGILLPIRQQGTRPPFFLVPGGSGGETEFLLYAPLIYLLGDEQPVYGLQARGLDGVTPPHHDIASMVADYLQAIRTVQPRGPYFLGGECIGGKIAFALASELQAQGEEVGLLVLLDTVLALTPAPKSQRQYLFQWARRRLGYHLQQLRQLPPRAQLNHLQKEAAVVWNVFGPKRHATPSERHRRQVQANYRYLASSYRPPQRYHGALTLLFSQQLYTGESVAAWRTLVAGSVDVYPVAGVHQTYLGEHVRGTAAQLRACLLQAQC